MADDDVNSDGCVGFQRRISDFKGTPVLVLDKQQEFTNSFSAVSATQEDNDSEKSSSALSAVLPSSKEGQQPIQDIPSLSKKVKSFLMLPERNRKILVCCDQEMFGSSCSKENDGLVSGFSACDGDSEDFSVKVADLDARFQETEKNLEILGSSGQEKDNLRDFVSGSLVCDANSGNCSAYAGYTDVQLQETKKFASVGEDCHGKIEGAVNDGKYGVGLSGVEESADNGILEESQTIEVDMGSVSEEAKETLLEAKKKQLLAKIKDSSLFINHEDNSLGFGILGGLEGIDESVKLWMKIDTVSVVKTDNNGVKNPSMNEKKKIEKLQADGNKSKRPRRKGKDSKRAVDKVTHFSKDLNNMIQIGQYQDSGPRTGDQIRKYSREEMEALRYVNIVQQRKFWRVIYTRLGDAVVKEYKDLANSSRRQKNFDSRKCSGRNEDVFGVLGKVCSENGDKLENMGEDEVENMNLLDPGCGASIRSEDADVEGGSCEEEDSDEGYASIQRPAFLVEGEPNFDSGPPEDGLEYLRRVRWEAAHIPKVKVAKLDRSKVNKEQSIYMPQIPEIAKCLQHLLPLKQWEDAFLTRFSELRMYLSGLGDSSTEISGKLQLLAIDQAYVANAGDGEIFTHSDNTILASASDSSCNYPTLSAIIAMDAVARVSMLKKRISLAETWSMLSRNDCMWLFALCAAVDTPLDADTCAALRSLLRKCASMRAVKSEVDDEVIMLNILITISGRYFGQSES